jgi:hypothetical protein
LIVVTTKSYTQGIREKRIKKFDYDERMKQKAADEAGKKEGKAE